MGLRLGKRLCAVVMVLVLCCGFGYLQAYGDDVAPSEGKSGEATTSQSTTPATADDGQAASVEVTTQSGAEEVEGAEPGAPQAHEEVPEAESTASEQQAREEERLRAERQAQQEEEERAAAQAKEEEEQRRQRDEQNEAKSRAEEEARAAQKAEEEAARARDEKKPADDAQKDKAQDAAAVGLEAQQNAIPTIHASGHVQRIGDTSYTSDNKGFVRIGTTGQSLRMEALGLSVQDARGTLLKGITYKAHVQGIGWQDWVGNGTLAGTRGEARRVEAIRIALSDELSGAYDIWYRVHIQRKGWLSWTNNGNIAGSVAQSLRMEAIELRLLPKGSAAPGDTGSAFVDGSGIGGSVHVQRIGWTSVKPGKHVTIGTVGQALRLEALRLSAVGFDLSGGLQYEAHVQRIGWQGMRSSGQTAGTEGQALRIEALRLSLTDELAAHYDVWYRVHVQSIGWLGWTSNGETAGTQGLSRRAEAIEIRLLGKGSGAPSSPDSALQNAFVDGNQAGVSYASYVDGSGWQGTVQNGATSGMANRGKRIESVSATLSAPGLGGGIEYRAHVQKEGWTGWKGSGQQVGTPKSGRRIEALGFRLTGMAAKTLSVWYRVYAQGIGWLGWTRDGADAGTSGQGRRAEAYQIRLAPRGGSAPGDTSNPFVSRTKHAHLVLIGDSRTCSLYDTQNDTDTFDLLATDSAGNTWSARVGAGFTWMRDEGVPRVENAIGADTAVVILMGVNDVALGSSAWNQYISYINQVAPRWIARGASVYYGSVGPIGMQTGDDDDGSGADYITNSGTITSWNNAMRAGLNTGCQYLDVYGALINDYSTADGTHYERATDRRFFSFIQNNVY